MIHLTKEKHTVFITTKDMVIPPYVANKYNYIELDYKSDVDLSIGLNFKTPQDKRISWGGLRANKNWRKVYLHINPEQASHPSSLVYQSKKYTPYIKASLPNNVDEAFIYLDNFKLIHEVE